MMEDTRPRPSSQMDPDRPEADPRELCHAERPVVIPESRCHPQCS
jgi:hypothetical protein